MPTLIPERLRAATIAVIGVCALVVALMGAWLHRAGATSFDVWAFRRSVSAIGPGGGRHLLWFSEPSLSFSVIVVVAALAAVARRWRLVILAAVGPVLAAVTTEYVLKPLIDRYLFEPGVPIDILRAGGGAFPSGHETGVASAALLALVAIGQLQLSAAMRAAGVAVLAVWSALGAVGLVRNYYHYATDTIGALGVSAVVVLGGALAIDAVPALVRTRQLT